MTKKEQRKLCLLETNYAQFRYSKITALVKTKHSNMSGICTKARNWQRGVPQFSRMQKLLICYWWFVYSGHQQKLTISGDVPSDFPSHFPVPVPSCPACACRNLWWTRRPNFVHHGSPENAAHDQVLDNPGVVTHKDNGSPTRQNWRILMDFTTWYLVGAGKPLWKMWVSWAIIIPKTWKNHEQ